MVLREAFASSSSAEGTCEDRDLAAKNLMVKEVILGDPLEQSQAQ